MSFGGWREVTTNLSGDSVEYACNDIKLISQLFNGVTSGIPAVKIKSTNGFYFCDSTLRFRNPLDSQTLTIRTPAITVARELAIPVITANDTIAVVTTPQTLSGKTLDATCDVSAATGGGTAVVKKGTLYVPLFLYPNWWVGSTYAWTPLFQAIAANPDVDWIIEINVDSGPGTTINTDYSQHGLVDLANAANAAGANVKVIGYISTLYGPANGGKSLVNVQLDVDRWFNFYSTWVDGCKFDEMDNVTGQESYYQSCTNYVKTKAWDGISWGNPGTSTISSYVPTMDVLIIVEADNSTRPSAGTMNTITFNGAYPKSKFAAIVFGQASFDLAYLNTSLLPYVQYVYVTNDVLANPYDTLPSYLTTFAGALVEGSGTGVSTSSSFITLSADPNTSGERVLTAGDGISITDTGAEGQVLLAQAIIDKAKKRVSWIEDFFGDSVDPGNSAIFQISNNGTGAQVSNLGVSETGIFGAWQLETGTTSSGRSGITAGNSNSFSLGQGPVVLYMRIRVPTLSDGTNTYILYVGMADNLSGSHTDAVQFIYDQATSANWRMQTMSNTTATTNTSSTAVGTTWVDLEIQVNATGTSVSFFVNGTQVANSPITTNIPVGAARALTVQAKIVKSAGSTNRTTNMDCFAFDYDLATAR